LEITDFEQKYLKCLRYSSDGFRADPGLIDIKKIILFIDI